MASPSRNFLVLWMAVALQVFSFTITTDQGETCGPFGLPDASQTHTFPVQFTARMLRFDAVETSGGNTGAVQIEVYGTPHE
jgi:hypothetical protein